MKPSPLRNDSSTGRMVLQKQKRKPVNGLPDRLCLQALFWISISAICGSVDGSLTVDINTDFQQNDDVNPCNFIVVSDKPSGFCYCNPNHDDPDEAEDVRCGFHTNPSEQEWRAIALFRNTLSIQFLNRPQGSIQEVPPPYVFVGMKNLHFFTMKMGAVENVPSFAFGNSSSLSDIDLSDCSIKELSSNAFANLIDLTEINLSENNLTEINRNAFVNLPKLKTLVFLKNSIQLIHDNAFRELRSLEDLALQNNRLTVIARDVFSGLQRLKHLDLHGNKIEWIGDHVFAEMPRLQDLDISENVISSVSSTAFVGLKQLTRLNLRENKIVRFHPDTFSHLSKIHFLDLQSNKLRALNHSLMTPIYKNLKNMNMQLMIAGNPFLCDCQALWMKTLYEETESPYLRTQLLSITCDMFENSSRQVPSSSSSPTFIHTDGTNKDLTMVTSDPEETTTYSLESVRSVVNLTAKDFNCNEDLLHHDHPDKSNLHRHQQSVTKFVDGDMGEGYRHRVISSPNRDSNVVSHQRDFEGIDTSDRSRTEGSEHHPRDSLLNEPQATAALEGENFPGAVPKTTSSADHKVDTARISSTQRGPSSSASLNFRSCDSVFRVSVLIALCLALVLI